MLHESVERDGLRLRILRGEPSPHRDTAATTETVLFVNAVGMPIDLLDDMARQFTAEGLDFVTWELRGSPGPGRRPDDSRLADHVADGLAVLDHLGVTAAHLAGWCTGASVALAMAGLDDSPALSLTSVDGAYLFNGVPGGPMGNAMFEMCGEIVADPAAGERYHELTRPRGNEAQVMGLLGSSTELVERLTLPYRGTTMDLVRYAHAIRSACDYDPLAAWSQITCPVLLTARTDDRMVSYRNSARAAELVTGARLTVQHSGGHYGLFTDPEAVPAMAGFMRAVADETVPCEAVSRS
ncbi:alpha/beta hydrolase [Streptomyces gobitricini]|uniref:AB hydrolase-1 domain-containing protein n=1 Tax=Streptomyces gobitricini TaxID=68211 RepID=A0ABP5YNT7_9ACTN